MLKEQRNFYQDKTRNNGIKIVNDSFNKIKTKQWKSSSASQVHNLPCIFEVKCLLVALLVHLHLALPRQVRLFTSNLILHRKVQTNSSVSQPEQYMPFWVNYLEKKITESCFPICH